LVAGYWRVTGKKRKFAVPNLENSPEPVQKPVAYDILVL
jgi:hypothetical protein